MGHIFISYSHKDKEYVHKLADALQSEGFDAWIDDRINYGTRWPLVIETAIDTCDAFILVASKNSHESEWVQHEFVRAQRLHKQFFPFYSMVNLGYPLNQPNILMFVMGLCQLANSIML